MTPVREELSVLVGVDAVGLGAEHPASAKAADTGNAKAISEFFIS
jgi:hypothetical protein